MAGLPSSAIFSLQSSSVACGPVTNVPLILVPYHPDLTPRRADSSGSTCRGKRVCMEVIFLVGLLGGGSLG